MDTTIFIFNIIYLLAFLYLIFLKDYLKQKGKNLATKEDIGKITTIVESVKHDFNRDIELLKISQNSIQISQKEIFESYLNLFIKIDKNKKFEHKDDLELRKLRLFIFLYSSDDTIRKFKEVNAINNNKTDNFQSVKNLTELILSMRKDLGYSNTNLSGDDLLDILIPNWREYISP